MISCETTKAALLVNVGPCRQAEQAKKVLQEADEERKLLEIAEGHAYPRKAGLLALFEKHAPALFLKSRTASLSIEDG